MFESGGYSPDVVTERGIVADVEVARAEFACDRGSARFARRFVAGRLDGHPSVGDAELLTSELVTNVVLHAHSSGAVVVSVAHGCLRVEVTDRSMAVPLMREPTEDGGRGLRLVEMLADRWGVAPDVGGKAVWFEIDEPAPSGVFVATVRGRRGERRSGGMLQ